MAAQLRFAQMHLKTQNVCNSVVWTDNSTVEMFNHNAQHHFWQKPTTRVRKHSVLDWPSQVLTPTL